MLSQKNLANFTKERPSLKVLGTPNLNATRSQVSERKSLFSAGSRFSKRSRVDAEVVRGSQNGSESHKRRIIDAVNQLTPEELEKVSEMLRASEVVQPNHEVMNRQRNRSSDPLEIDGEVRVDDEGADAEIEAADQVDELR